MVLEFGEPIYNCYQGKNIFTSLVFRLETRPLDHWTTYCIYAKPKNSVTTNVLTIPISQ